MELRIEPRRPTEPTFASLLPTARVDRRRNADGGKTLPMPSWRQSSSWVPCECPDDCPRDHQNE